MYPLILQFVIAAISFVNDCNATSCNLHKTTQIDQLFKVLNLI